MMLGHASRDHAVRLSIAWRVHIAFDEAHAPFAVHGGQVHLTGLGGWQPYMARLANLGGDDVHIDGEQSTRLDGIHDGINHAFAVTPGTCSWHLSQCRCASCISA